jgi:hypothetical protein
MAAIGLALVLISVLSYLDRKWTEATPEWKLIDALGGYLVLVVGGVILLVALGVGGILFLVYRVGRASDPESGPRQRKP